MGPNMMLQLRTAMGEDRKMRCLSNDLIRHLSNTGEMMGDEER